MTEVGFFCIFAGKCEESEEQQDEDEGVNWAGLGWAGQSGERGDLFSSRRRGFVWLVGPLEGFLGW